MARVFAWLVLAAVVLGVAGLAITTEQASAQELSLDCEQTVDPTGAGTKGEVTCTLTVTDLPPPLSDFSLTLVATYTDVDGDGAPSPGDQLQCISVSGTSPTGDPISVEFCRSDEPEPPPIPTPPF